LGVRLAARLFEPPYQDYFLTDLKDELDAVVMGYEPVSEVFEQFVTSIDPATPSFPYGYLTEPP